MIDRGGRAQLGNDKTSFYVKPIALDPTTSYTKFSISNMDIISGREKVKPKDTSDNETVQHSNKCKVNKKTEKKYQNKRGKYGELSDKLNLMLGAMVI